MWKCFELFDKIFCWVSRNGFMAVFLGSFLYDLDFVGDLSG